MHIIADVKTRRKEIVVANLADDAFQENDGDRVAQPILRGLMVALYI